MCRRLNGIDTVVIGTRETFCRVCGYDDHPDERFSDGVPQYLICPCCGSESGIDDVTHDLVRRSRETWVDRGRTWQAPEERPADWDPGVALAALPARWRDL
ncbi:hypothetical protein [Blastococcus aurantiacus]|uniref:hypothetical protein n=1 Tax=Blastococcus aurantiacus TaxID=1550231 RepID=UPI001C40BA4A|nr:hypothetical protein [Blastococcus aurantiacus]